MYSLCPDEGSVPPTGWDPGWLPASRKSGSRRATIGEGIIFWRPVTDAAVKAFTILPAELIGQVVTPIFALPKI